MPQSTPRFEDSPGLFGAGVGQSTCSYLACEFCNAVFNEDCGGDEDSTGDWIKWEDFAGLTVCEDCFGKVERAVWNRRVDVLKWMRRLVERKMEEADSERRLFDGRFSELLDEPSGQRAIGP